MTDKFLSIDDYTYELPDQQIAKFPVEPRDSSKLLVYQNGEISENSFRELPALLPQNALLVFNDTKVIPARLFFQKQTGATIEIFLLQPILPSSVISVVMESTQSCVWNCMIGNKKKWKGERLIAHIGNYEISAELTDSEQNLVQFSWKGTSFAELIRLFGEMPLPPYLNRKTEKKDLETYQTVYSENDGAVAAPTAGLHFTQNVLEELTNKRIETDFLTLHVGAGTFQPVKAENALEHTMHREQIVVTKSFIEGLKKRNSCVIPVGTTSMRSLESIYWFGVKLWKADDKKNVRFFIEKLFPYQFENEELPKLDDILDFILMYMTQNQQETLVGETEIFIFEGYNFKICKGIITNFHQPKSTLLLLISALIGSSWKKVYNYALTNQFRFLSYGDSSLLLP
jgi:S-adenosylmethionine:tRNA ribosyltransferase-isomerase